MGRKVLLVGGVVIGLGTIATLNSANAQQVMDRARTCPASGNCLVNLGT